MIAQDHPNSKNFVTSELPARASHTQVISYKRIRLSSLYTNPEAFSSTFARESVFTPQTWFDRVNVGNGTKRIFVATPGHRDILSNTRNKPTYPDWDTGDEEISNEPWMGTVCVLWPEIIKAILHTNPLPPDIAVREDKGEVEVFMIVGMWVHPDSRRLGVGKGLVEHAVQSVNSLESGTPRRKRAVVLRVHKRNKAAVDLYKSVGFLAAGSEDESGESWMVYEA